LAISLAVLPWVDLSWWKVFRRCVSIASMITLIVFMRRVHHWPWRRLGLVPWREGRRLAIAGMLLGLATMTIMGGVYIVTGVWRPRIHPDHLRVLRVVALSIPAMALVAVIEELIFRGYILTQLRACHKELAVHGSSLAYALVHLRGTPTWPGTLLELTGLYLLGWVLSSAVLRTGQLWPAIGLHAVLAYAARVNKLVVEFSGGAAPWLVGTSRLINGVGAWVALGVLGWVIARYGARLAHGRQVDA
jgi:membrane protease YdiL (CAAX protease family)